MMFVLYGAFFLLRRRRKDVKELSISLPVLEIGTTVNYYLAQSFCVDYEYCIYFVCKVIFRFLMYS